MSVCYNLYGHYVTWGMSDDRADAAGNRGTGRERVARARGAAATLRRGPGWPLPAGGRRAPRPGDRLDPPGRDPLVSPPPGAGRAHAQHDRVLLLRPGDLRGPNRHQAD